MNNMTVALLFHDLKVAKEISKIFRKIGVVPYLYDNLDEYWSGTLSQTPSFSIVDVRLMSQGERTLKDHPLVKADRAPISFYYKKEFSPLVVSTYDIFHLGLLDGEKKLEAQLKNVLKRLNKFLSLEKENSSLDLENQKFSKQVSSTILRNQQLKEYSYYGEELTRICRRFVEYKDQKDFFGACEKVLGNEEFFSAFSYVELSLNGQKILSPNSSAESYMKIPSLWLKSVCTKGIEPFAQTLASQVAVDLMGGDLISILLTGAKNLPQAILFIRPATLEALNLFDWEFFENHLNGVYSNFHLQAAEDFEVRETLLSPWGLLSRIDDQFFSSLSGRSVLENEELKVVSVNFSKLIDLVRSQGEVRYYWETFFNDFTKRLYDNIDLDFKVSSIGINDFTFLVQDENLDLFFDKLQAFVNQFSYWRYFEDVDTILAKNFTPTVKVIPNSSEAIFEYLEQKTLSQNSLAYTPSKKRQRSLQVQGRDLYL